MSHKIPDHTVEDVRPMYPFWKGGSPRGLHQYPRNQKKEVFGGFAGGYQKVFAIDPTIYDKIKEVAIWTGDYLRIEVNWGRVDLLDRIRSLHTWSLKALNAVQQNALETVNQLPDKVTKTEPFRKLEAQVVANRKKIAALQAEFTALKEQVEQMEKQLRAKL